MYLPCGWAGGIRCDECQAANSADARLKLAMLGRRVQAQGQTISIHFANEDFCRVLVCKWSTVARGRAQHRHAVAPRVSRNVFFCNAG
jgi:hypothetical protein